ncbi:MAG TPA: hypothetical protein VKC90_13405 [Chitinophagaceae bacterium]|nr:hypothetical protein [Chitinophagaceae bacterium]
MKGPQEQYTNELSRKFGYKATWLPGMPLRLGDIGILNNYVYTPVTTLEFFQIPFEVREDDTKDDLEYSSNGQITITSKISGTVSPAGSTFTNSDAGLIVEFSSQNSIFFKANQAQVILINNTNKIGEEIIKLYEEGKWNKHWVVITQLVKAESATILLSNSSNAKIELKANANINSSNLDIADAQFNFSSSFLKGLETKIIAQRGLTPLFKVKGLRNRIFLPPSFIDRGMRAFDLVTPETARSKYKDEIYFDFINEDLRFKPENV